MSMPTALTLRPAQAQEALTMACMSRDLIEVGLAWRYTPQRLAALIEDRETLALVACDAQRIKGFAVMQFGDDKAHLMLLCVAAAQQRLGIGRRLLDWLVASARVAGMASVELELRADNAGALVFYRQQDFGQEMLLPGYYGEQIAARRMTRSLRAVDPPA